MRNREKQKSIKTTEENNGDPLGSVIGTILFKL